MAPRSWVAEELHLSSREETVATFLLLSSLAFLLPCGFNFSPFAIILVEAAKGGDFSFLRQKRAGAWNQEKTCLKFSELSRVLVSPGAQETSPVVLRSFSRKLGAYTAVRLCNFCRLHPFFVAWGRGRNGIDCYLIETTVFTKGGNV